MVTKLAWLFAVFLIGNLVLGLSSHALGPEGLMAMELFVGNVVVATVGWMGVRSWASIGVLLSLPRVPLFAWIRITLITSLTLVPLALVFEALDAAGFPLVNATAHYLAAGWSPLFIYGWLAIVPACVEELAFRGLLQAGLAQLVSEREAWILQGVLFGVAHLWPLNFVTHTVLGLLFGWVRSRSGSIVPSILLHALWNGWVVFGELH